MRAARAAISADGLQRAELTSRYLVRDGRRKILSRSRGRESRARSATPKIAVNTVVAAEVTPVYDAVILTCRPTISTLQSPAIAPALAPDGFVLPLLNGIAHIDRLNETFGRHRVLGGTAKSRRRSCRTARSGSSTTGERLTFGEQSGEMTERVTALAAHSSKAAKGVEGGGGGGASPVLDIVQRMWRKLVHLSTAAATPTCLMRAKRCGEIFRTPPWTRRFADGAASLRCCDRRRQRSRAQCRAFMKNWEETFSQQDSAVFDVNAARHRTGWADGGGAHPRLHAGQGRASRAIPSNTLLLAYTSIKAFEQRRAAGRLA